MRLEPSHRSSSLSTVRQLPTSQSVPENALNRTSILVGNLQLGSSTTNVFAPSDRAKFSDYIETILHCKGLSCLLIRRAYILLGFDLDAHRDCIDRDSHPPVRSNGMMHLSFVGIARVVFPRRR